MEKNMNNIDHLFKDELGGYTEVPPPAVWDALEKRLQGDDKRRVYPYRWLWYVGIVSFIVLLGSSIAWMMAINAGNRAHMATTSTVATELPKNTAVAAVNGKLKNTDRNANNAKIATRTRSSHRKAGSSVNKSAKSNSPEERAAITNRKRDRKHHQNHSAKPNNTKKTSDDLYADTDDDQYIVGGTGTPHKNYETPGNDGTGEAYVSRAKSQHNIHVAEMEPAPAVRENNYGNYTVVTANKAKEIANAHYDIDLEDKSIPESGTSKTHAAHKTRTPKSTVASVGIAGNIHTSTRKQTIHTSQNTSGTHSNEAKRPAVSGSATASVATTRKHAPERKHTNVSVNEPKKATVGSSKQLANNTPIAQTDVKQPIPTRETNAVGTSNRKIAFDNSAAGHKVTTKKIDVINNAAGKPVASARQSATPKAPTHKVPHTAQNDKVQKHVEANSTPVLAAAVPAKMPNAAPAQKTKSDNKIVKTSINKYAASSQGKKTAKKQDSKTVVPVAAEKQDRTTASVKDKIANNTKISKRPSATTQAKSSDRAPVTAVVKKTADHIQMQEKQPAPGKQAPKTTTVSDKPLVKHEQTPAKKEVIGKSQKSEPVAATNKLLAKNDNKPAKKEPERKANTKKTVAPLPVKPPVNIYSSSLTKRSLEQEFVVVDNLKVNNFEAQLPQTDAYYELLPSTFKSDAGAEKAKGNATDATNNTMNDSAAKHSLFARKFEYGVKGGVETGFNARAANKLVVSPYLQYNISDRFSILTQPSAKVAHVNQSGVGDSRSYNDNSKGKFTETDSGAVYFVVPVGASSVVIRDTLRKYNYAYDSIVKSYSTGGTYMEVELPLLLQYKISNKLSVYGGANMVFSKYTSIKENTNDYNANFKTITISPAGNGAQTPSAANLHLPGTPISQYSGPLYPAQKGDLFRIGYMLGFSYEYKKRWLFDALVQQAMVKPNYEAGVNTNATLAMPYFRLTLGYKLTK